jgi:hypothetical protein
MPEATNYAKNRVFHSKITTKKKPGGDSFLPDLMRQSGGLGWGWTTSAQILRPQPPERGSPMRSMARASEESE